MESVHNFVFEYKSNFQNESMIKSLPKHYDLLNLMLMLFQKQNGLKGHIPLRKYHSYIKKKRYWIEVSTIIFLWWVSMGYESNKNECWVGLFNN